MADASLSASVLAESSRETAAERGLLEGWSVGPGAGFFAEIEVQLMEDSLRMSGGCQRREPRLSSRQFARTARGPFQVPPD
jgi:hypothetical protein